MSKTNLVYDLPQYKVYDTVLKTKHDFSVRNLFN